MTSPLAGADCGLDLNASADAEVVSDLAKPAFAFEVIRAPFNPRSRPVFGHGIFTAAPAVVFKFSHSVLLWVCCVNGERMNP